MQRKTRRQSGRPRGGASGVPQGNVLGPLLFLSVLESIVYYVIICSSLTRDLLLVKYLEIRAVKALSMYLISIRITNLVHVMNCVVWAIN